MEQQQSSTSKVTVEYHDPHNVYNLLAPGLVPRLPLHNLHWQSHSGPLRSIGTLHVDLIQAGAITPAASTSASASTPSLRTSDSTIRDDGFQTQNVGGRATSSETVESLPNPPGTPGFRRHQIPGLRKTPYLKVLLVRCDDNDSYKSSVRSEVREWIKTHTVPVSTSKKASTKEAHDAFEWLILHVVIPNTVAATQPRSSNIKLESSLDGKSSSRWRPGTSTPLMEKFRSDFNGSNKAVDRVAQIRIGINDVPYDLLPRVVPAVPSGYMETDSDAEAAWNELIAKWKDLILSSFDKRVTQYEDDIKEKDSQRLLPGWNFCTFFILKEGLARGFENVGLVEDALVGYDELSVGLDTVIQEQDKMGAAERHGGLLLIYTEELKTNTEKILAEAVADEEAVDLQLKDAPKEQYDEIPIGQTKKAYRDMILANKVSVFDFRCYIFSRQIALLLRLGNASSTREELLAKLKEQEESILHGVAPRAPPPQRPAQEGENLSYLAEICRRTLEFIPQVSRVMRQDITAALAEEYGKRALATSDPAREETVDNIVTSFAFSIAQQILAQTSTKALPIPPSTLPPASGDEQKASIPEPKTMMHPARSTSLYTRPTERPPPSPGVFPSVRPVSLSEGEYPQISKAGLENLAAMRADLYLLSRSILDGLGKKRGWSNGWDKAPLVGDPEGAIMVDISLNDDTPAPTNDIGEPSSSGIGSQLLATAADNAEDFYRLYEILTDKALRHYTVAGHDHSVQANMSDLAVLKFHLKEYRAATSFFCLTTPFFGESGWSWLELSMLVMYSHCLRVLKHNQDYVRVALKLLTKACVAEKEWLQQRSAIRLRGEQKKEFPDMSAIGDTVGSLSDLVRSLPTEAKVPLDNFFTDIELVGAPEYHDGRDSCDLTISLRCLLPEGLHIDAVALKVTSEDSGPAKAVWFEKKGDISMKRGTNTIKVECRSVVPGRYIIDHLELSSEKLLLHFDRNANLPVSSKTEIFRHPDVKLYQRVGALDVDLTATKHTALDKNNALDLVLSTGWNDLTACEVRVKPATGGLRLLTREAKFVNSEHRFAKTPEAGLFFFGAVEKNTNLTIRFPYTLEQDIGIVAARLEVTYITACGQYYLAKALSIPVSLAVGVNVQDIFKHNALFSRFSVSTATPSPLRLFKSELLESELFESEFGVSCSQPITIFPKQAANLLYKITRKPGARSNKPAAKTMYLKLHYSLLHTDVEELISLSIEKYISQSPLAQCARTIRAIIVDMVRSGLGPQDLERAALLGEIPTAFLQDIPWDLSGLGIIPSTTSEIGPAIAKLLNAWQSENSRLRIPAHSVSELSSILIPVEIPSVAVVHTADIRLEGGDLVVGQVMSATLFLKWTRGWDTEERPGAQEFSYEVTAPGDMWLLGGRRRGHFVVPSSSHDSSTTTDSAVPNDLRIPIILIPQREGTLPYPTIEIREPEPKGFEVDWRNLGESVRVDGGRRGLTVCLDASGSGGGPLVLGGEEWGVSARA